LPYPKRTSLKLIAAVLGILATGVPMVLFNIWLKKQGDAEVSITAALALASTEIQIRQTVAALSALSAEGVDSCGPAGLEAMRQATLLTGPIKEVMLIARNGQVLCTSTGGPPGHSQLVGSASTSEPGIMLDVIGSPDRNERFLRVRKLAEADKPGFAALVSASLLLPQVSIQNGRMPSYAQLTLPGGAVIGESGAAPHNPNSEESFLHRLRSPRYRVTLTIAMARNGVIADYEDLRRIGMVVTGAIALVILLFALIFPWRNADNPLADLAKGILADEFVPYFQPVVDLQNGRLLGAEVLVRWKRQDGSIVEPGTFVPLMESSGLVLDLTRSLMRRVRNDLGEAIGCRSALSIAFNIAPVHFEDALILNDVGTIFDGSPIKLSQIVLELTERHEVRNLTAMRRTIAALQGLGCRVAIDDVGTGHSGLSYILKLGVDIIKIDKIFVEAIGSEGHSKAIIETLIDLANNMRMEIIAEGVESFDQVSYLRERGIRAAQGYAFAPPLSAASFRQLLDAMDPLAAAESAPAKKKPVAVAAAKAPTGMKVAAVA
jgi:sensor c-di-GMP phosphodiesterase-like protein